MKIKYLFIFLLVFVLVGCDNREKYGNFKNGDIVFFRGDTNKVGIVIDYDYVERVYLVRFSVNNEGNREEQFHVENFMYFEIAKK